MNTFHVRKTGDVILLHLGKGDDMLQCLNQAITEHKIKNGAVVSMIGTLDKARYHMIRPTVFIPWKDRLKWRPGRG